MNRKPTQAELKRAAELARIKLLKQKYNTLYK